MSTPTAFMTILTRLAATALPISAGRLIFVIANLLAMMMVAKLGKAQVAAGFLAWSSVLTVLTFTTTIFYAIGIQIRFVGQQNNPQAVGLIVKNGFLLAMLVAIPAAFAIVHMDSMLLFLGQDPELIALTTGYFWFAGIGMFPLLAMMVIGQFYMGIGKPVFTFINELISFPLSILLSYGFVLGHFGLPALGLRGVSLATLLTQTIILLGTLIVVYFTKQKYRLFSRVFIDWSVCRSLLSLGLPIGIQFGGELAAVALAGYFMGYFGVDALAALQVTNQYSLLFIMLSIGLAQGLSLQVSEAFGQTTPNPAVIKQYVFAGVVLLLAYIVPVSLVFALGSTVLGEFYLGTSLETEFAALLHALFILGALFLFLDGLRNLLSATLRGLQDTKTATRINLFALWIISIPASAWAAFYGQGGPVALRMGFLTGFIAAVLSLIMHLKKKLQIKELVFA